MLSTAHQAQADAVQTEIFRRMSPTRKLELTIAMQQQARDLMDSGLKLSHPHLSATERQREIAHRILHARS
jgi:hypothetical protein